MASLIWDRKSDTVDLEDPAQLQRLLDKHDQRTPLQKFLSKALPPLQRFNDFISKPRYAIGGLLTGKGVREGIKQKTNPSEAFGIGKETKLWSAKGVGGLAIDTLFDPLTYISFGASTKAAKVFTKAGTKVLTQEGMRFPSEIVKRIPDSAVLKIVAKDAAANPGMPVEVLTQIAKQKVATASAEKYFRRLAEKGLPEAKRFFDQGGIKFAGQTIIPAESIAKTYGVGAGALKTVVRAIPGGKELVTGLEESTRAIAGAFNSNAGKNGFFEKTAVQTHKDMMDYAAHATSNTGAKTLAGTKNVAERKAVAHYIDMPALIETYGKNLEHFPDATIRKELLDAFALVDNSDRLKSVVRRVDAHFKALYTTDQKAGLTYASRKNYLALYSKKNTPMAAKDWYTRMPSSVLQNAKKREIPTIAEARLLGLDPEEDIARIFAKRTMSSAKAIANRELITSAAKEFGAGAVKMDNPVIPQLKAQILDFKTQWDEQLSQLPTATTTNYWSTLGRDKGGFTNKVVLNNDLIAKLKKDGWTLPKLATADIDGYFDDFDQWKSQLDRLGAVVGDKKARQLVKQAQEALEGLPGFEDIPNQINDLRFQLSKAPKRINNIKKFANPEDAAKFLDDYVAFSDPSVGSIYLPRTIAQSLQEVAGANPVTDEATSALLRGYDKVNNFYKGALTSWIPAYHGRNVIGNVANSFLGIGVDAVNPVRAAQSAKVMSMMKQLNGLGKELPVAAQKELMAQVFTDKFGTKITAGQLIQEIQTMGIDKTFNTSSELGMDVIKTLERNLGTTAKKFVQGDYGKAFGSMLETHSRVQFFMSKRLAGHSAQSAAELTKQFLFDYDNLSKFEKTFMRRAIPFYTWTRKNIGLQAQNMLSQPVKYGVMAQISEKMNAGISQEDLEKMPDWLKDQINIVTGRKGKELTVLAGFGIPMVDAISRVIPESFDLKGILKQTEEILNQGAFVPKTIIELATGRDFFKHKAIEDQKFLNRAQFEAMPGFLQDFLLVKDIPNEPFVLIDPQRKKIIDSLPTTRAGQVYSGLSRDDKTATLKALKLLTGISEYNVDTTETNSQITKDLQRELLKRGVIAEFTKLFVPKDK